MSEHPLQSKGRHVRIEGKPDDIRGWQLHVRDAETGEEIPGVTHVMVVLSPSRLNRAHITYFDQRQSPRLSWKYQQAIVDDPEIAVSAIETRHPFEIEQVTLRPRALSAREVNRASDAFILGKRAGWSPLEATGTIGDDAAFYFRGLDCRWQFIAGPQEEDQAYGPASLAKESPCRADKRILILEGYDDTETYLQTGAAEGLISVCVQQFLFWRDQNKG